MYMDKRAFLNKFLQSPQTVGSITPSSRFLAKSMMKYVDWENARSIVELGAGTGIFTRYINELKHPDSQVVVFERDQEMRKKLEAMYPTLDYHSNAKDIHSVIKLMGLQEVDCVLSGLPFANFPEEVRDDIMEGILRSLKPGGLFIAFQYSLQMKKRLDYYFNDTDITFVLLNFPPAFVYCCKKK
jgi:phospholipid N-methyltransferase